MSTMNPEDFKRASVNLETARIAWKELQRYFASGAAIAVSADLDLIEVAYQMSEDNKTQVVECCAAQQPAWCAAAAGVCAVVDRPCVLVQSADKAQYRYLTFFISLRFFIS